MNRLVLFFSSLTLVANCTPDLSVGLDASRDAANDADASRTDAPRPDVSRADATVSDTRPVDVIASDMGTPDAGPVVGPSPRTFARFSNAGPLARDDFFPIGAFYQSPVQPSVGGTDNAGALAAMGINVITNYGPSDTDAPGELARWQSAGIYVFWDPKTAGSGLATALSILSQHPELNSTVIGWNTIRDESDGLYTDPNFAPLPSLAIGNETRATDPTRPVQANFAAQMIRRGPIVFYHPDQVPMGDGTGTVQGDMDAYAQAVNLASYDLYVFTRALYVDADPAYTFDASGGIAYRRGIWIYGRLVDSLRASVWPTNPTCPVMPVLEDANPFIEGDPEHRPGPTPDEIQSMVWLNIVHGARGIIYFAHASADDGNATSGVGYLSSHSLTDPNQYQIDAKVAALTALHARIRSLAPVLNSPTLGEISMGNSNYQLDGRELLPAGYALTTDNGVPVDTMVRQYGGQTYWFAIATGDEMHPDSGATVATFTAASAAGKTITVRDEGRMIVADANGNFTDSFDPYRPHIYVWE